MFQASRNCTKRFWWHLKIKALKVFSDQMKIIFSELNFYIIKLPCVYLSLLKFFLCYLCNWEPALAFFHFLWHKHSWVFWPLALRSSYHSMFWIFYLQYFQSARRKKIMQRICLTISFTICGWLVLWIAYHFSLFVLAFEQNFHRFYDIFFYTRWKLPVKKMFKINCKLVSHKVRIYIFILEWQ